MKLLLGQKVPISGTEERKPCGFSRPHWLALLPSLGLSHSSWNLQWRDELREAVDSCCFCLELKIASSPISSSGWARALKKTQAGGTEGGA